MVAITNTALSMRMALVGYVLAVARSAEAQLYANATVTQTAAPTQYITEVVTAVTTFCPAPTTLTFNNHTYIVTSPTTLTITDCPCTVTKPAAPTAPSQDECAKACYDAYNKCRGAPHPNFSICGSEYAACLGYNPFGGNGTLNTPTACSNKPATPTTSLSVITTYCPEPTTLSYPHTTYTITGPTSLTITVSKPTAVVPVGTATTTPSAVATAAAGRLAPGAFIIAFGVMALL